MRCANAMPTNREMARMLCQLEEGGIGCHQERLLLRVDLLLED